MKYYILGKKGYTWKTSVTLAKRFRYLGYQFFATTCLKTNQGPIIVNWGNSRAKECLGKPLNQDIITNKFHQLEVLREANIRTLKVSRNIADFEEEDYPLLCRQKIHQAGNDIVVAQEVDDLVQCHFYSKFEKFKRELRIHVFQIKDDLITRTFKKIHPEDERGIKFPIRNLEHGYLFRKVAIGEKLTRLLSEVLVALKMDFFCADIGISYIEREKVYTVIEVNSAPSLINNRNSLDWYVNNIGRSMIENWGKIEPEGV